MREYGPEGGRNLLLHLESEEHAKGQGMEGLSEIPLYAHIKVRVLSGGRKPRLRAAVRGNEGKQVAGQAEGEGALTLCSCGGQGGESRAGSSTSGGL